MSSHFRVFVVRCTISSAYYSLSRFECSVLSFSASAAPPVYGVPCLRPLNLAFSTWRVLWMMSEKWIGPFDTFWPRHYKWQAAMVFMLGGGECERRYRQHGYEA